MASRPRRDRFPDAVRRLGPGLVFLVALAALATGLSGAFTFISPLVAGVILGAMAVNFVAIPEAWGPGIAFGAKRLLRAGIVLLGLRLSLGDLVEVGPAGLASVVGVVAITFVGTQFIGRYLGVPDRLSLLVATGYAICGASAIAAMDGVIGADEEETAYAVTLVTLFGTLSIFVLPLIASVAGSADPLFGAWVGAAVHDVGQVVATASTRSQEAIESATIVKLTRVVLLAPLVTVMAIRHRQAGSASTGRRQPLLPLFVAGFLGSMALRSSGVLPSSLLEAGAAVEKVLFTIALVGLGAGVRVASMRQLGGRPLVLGSIAWVIVAGVAYLATSIAM